MTEQRIEWLLGQQETEGRREILDFQNHGAVYGRFLLASLPGTDTANIIDLNKTVDFSTLTVDALKDRNYNPVVENFSLAERKEEWKGIEYSAAYIQWRTKFTDFMKTKIPADSTREEALRIIMSDSNTKAADFTEANADGLFEKFCKDTSNIDTFVKSVTQKLATDEKIDPAKLRRLLPELQWIASGLFGKNTASTVVTRLIELESELHNDPQAVLNNLNLNKDRINTPQPYETNILGALYQTLPPQQKIKQVIPVIDAHIPRRDRVITEPDQDKYGPSPPPPTQKETTKEQPSFIATPLLAQEGPQETSGTTGTLADAIRKAFAQSRTAAAEKTPAPVQPEAQTPPIAKTVDGWKLELPKGFQRELTFDGKTYTFVAGIDLGIEDAGYVGQLLRYTSPSGDIAIKVISGNRPTSTYEREKLLRNELHFLEKINTKSPDQSWFPKPVGIIERSTGSPFSIAVSFCEGKNLNSRGFLKGLNHLERLYIAGELLKAFETARNAGVIVMDWKMKDVLVNVKNAYRPQSRFNMGDVHCVDVNVATETESQNDYFLYQVLGTLWSRIIVPLIANDSKSTYSLYIEDDKLKEMGSVLSLYNTQPKNLPKFPEFIQQLKDRLNMLFDQQLRKEPWETPEQEGVDQEAKTKAELYTRPFGRSSSTPVGAIDIRNFFKK